MKKMALVFDALTAISTFLGVLFIFLDVRFMADYPRLSETPFFLTFTGLSNAFAGGVSLLCVVLRLLYKDKLPNWAFLLRLFATSFISITFLVTATYLSISLGSSWWRLYINGTFFNHFLTPVLCILGFLLFEERTELRWRNCLFGLIPISAYGVFYLIYALPHYQEGQPVDLRYDIYGLTRFGIPITVVFLTAFLGLSLGLTTLFYFQNRCKKQANSRKSVRN